MTTKLSKPEFVCPSLVTTKILARQSRAKKCYDGGISVSQQTEIQLG